MKFKSLFSFLLPKHTLADGLARTKEKFGIEGEPVFKGFIDNGRMYIREYITPKNELVVFLTGSSFLSIEKYLPTNANIKDFIGQLAHLHKRFENNSVVKNGKKMVDLDRTVITGVFDNGQHSGYSHEIMTTDNRAANIGIHIFKDNPAHIQELRVNNDTPILKVKSIPYEMAVSMGLKV